MRILKKAFLISFIFVLIFCTTVLPTYAAIVEGSVADSTVNFDETDVLDDLSDNLPDIEAFESTDICVVSFMEYCFSTVEGVSDKYGLYLYVYNPLQKEILTDSVANQVLIGTDFDERGYPKTYSYYNVECVDWVDDTESIWYKRLYKFKLKDPFAIYSSMVKTPNERNYYVSGIELQILGNHLAVEYPIATKYTFKGYAKGCGVNMSVDDLTVTSQPMDVVLLDGSTDLNKVYATDWLTQSSDYGKGYRNQVQSVYFAIDNSLLKKYGDVDEIEWTCFQYKLNPVLVTNDKGLKTYFDNNGIGRKTCDPVNESVEFCLTVLADNEFSYTMFDYLYNFGDIFANKKTFTNIPLCFYTSQNVTDYHLDSSTIEEAVLGFKWHYGDGDNVIIKNYAYPKYLFADVGAKDADGNPLYGEKHVRTAAKNLITLNNYDSNHSWWDKLNQYGFFGFFKAKTDDEYGEQIAIRRVSEKDMSVEDLSTHLMINQNDVKAFRDFYEKANAADKTVFLFRFAVTPYFSIKVNMETTEGWFEDAPFESTGDQYELRQTDCFLNFDIITFYFKNAEGTVTALPCVMSPIDIFPSMAPAQDYTPKISDFLDWLKKLLLIILGVVVGVVVIIAVFALLSMFFPNILSGLVKGLLYILSLPFRGIAWLWNLIFDNDEKKNK